MRVVLLTSPGAVAGLHWSFDHGERLHRALVDAGHVVRWLAPVVAGANVSPATAAEILPVAAAPLHRVAAAVLHDDLERELARELRTRPADLVVHLGLGARGSANLLWLADRMGSRTIAIVRAAEILCHRGDRIDERGQACAVIDDPDRCRACCSSGLRRAPRSAFANRLDLLIGSLQVTTDIFLSSSTDSDLLTQLGLPLRQHRLTDPVRTVPGTHCTK